MAKKEEKASDGEEGAASAASSNPTPTPTPVDVVSPNRGKYVHLRSTRYSIVVKHGELVEVGDRKTMVGRIVAEATMLELNGWPRPVGLIDLNKIPEVRTAPPAKRKALLDELIEAMEGEEDFLPNETSNLDGYITYDAFEKLVAKRKRKEEEQKASAEEDAEIISGRSGKFGGDEDPATAPNPAE